jgi:Putative zinc-finger
MNSNTSENSNLCPKPDISAYIDCELSPADEIRLEMHVAECTVCSAELNQQKMFLAALNSTLLREDEVDLPKNFTRIIVTNAESSVSGLRRPNERFNAVFICGALFLFVLFALGGEAGRGFDSTGKFIDQVFTVVGLAGHVLYSVVIGITLILKSISSQFVSSSASAFTFLTCIFLVSLIAFSRLMLRFKRTS